MYRVFRRITDLACYVSRKSHIMLITYDVNHVSRIELLCLHCITERTGLRALLLVLLPSWQWFVPLVPHSVVNYLRCNHDFYGTPEFHHRLHGLHVPLKRVRLVGLLVLCVLVLRVDTPHWRRNNFENCRPSREGY